MGQTSAVAKNKDHMMQRIMSDHQLPSVEPATDCLALNFWFSHATRNPTNSKKKESKAKKRKKNKRNGERTLKDPLRSLLTIISKVYKKPTCLYIEPFMCCLTTAILQSYTVFANVQFEKSLSKKEEEGKKKKKKKRSMTVSQSRWESKRKRRNRVPVRV